MAEQRDASEIQREIETKRNELATVIERLRFAVRRRVDPLAQLRAHPGVALALGIALSLPLLAVAALVRARRRRLRALRMRRRLGYYYGWGLWG